ncbi:hypothetical protein M7I_0348 [Glarea lozoyensis 74030]|uniref:Uncharacterized protein n=1 Tax=Glarea lozoyensis (strain ATCC 74030 / MF5533) TaxID=1104152 RepID=H0ED48_GLAL7|nr:hypothetical protein M7I_0348 [Glarea lozoyensis 74030]
MYTKVRAPLAEVGRCLPLDFVSTQEAPLLEARVLAVV